MQNEITDSEIKFSKIFYQYNKNWSIIWSYRTITGFSLRKGIEDYEKYTRETINEMKPGGYLENVLTDPAAFWDSDEPEKMTKRAAKEAFDNSKNLIDCVSLVFAHSVLDDYFYKLIQIAYNIRYSIFFDFVKDQKVEVADIIENQEACLKGKLDKWLIKVERDSLLEKTDYLYLICTSNKKPVHEGNYIFDRKRLGDLDERRRRIVHEPDIVTPISNIEQDLWYLYRTGPHFLYLMNKKFKLRIVPSAFH